MIPVIHTPTTLVTGFLGAGKTTLINALLAHKPTHEKWAFLINEFGQIGIDGSLIHTDKKLIREVNGGCICCSSQLPLQIGLARLLQERPHRLIIEPTGLAMADELLKELTSTHWRQSLKLNTVIGVLNTKQWQDEKYRSHSGYQTHIKYADVVVINQVDALGGETAPLREWIQTLNPHANIVYFEALSHHLDELFHQVHQVQIPINTISLAPPNNINASQISSAQSTPANAPPYRYHDKLNGYVIGGWVLPKEWVFDEYELQKWLLSLPNYERIKGIVHSSNGYLSINITPCDIAIAPHHGANENKLEFIFNEQNNNNWNRWDEQLLALVISDK